MLSIRSYSSLIAAEGAPCVMPLLGTPRRSRRRASMGRQEGFPARWAAASPRTARSEVDEETRYCSRSKVARRPSPVAPPLISAALSIAAAALLSLFCYLLLPPALLCCPALCCYTVQYLLLLALCRYDALRHDSAYTPTLLLLLVLGEVRTQQICPPAATDYADAKKLARVQLERWELGVGTRVWHSNLRFLAGILEAKATGEER